MSLRRADVARSLRVEPFDAGTAENTEETPQTPPLMLTSVVIMVWHYANVTATKPLSAASREPPE